MQFWCDFWSDLPSFKVVLRQNNKSKYNGTTAIWFIFPLRTKWSLIFYVLEMSSKIKLPYTGCIFLVNLVYIYILSISALIDSLIFFYLWTHKPYFPILIRPNHQFQHKKFGGKNFTVRLAWLRLISLTSFSLNQAFFAYSYVSIKHAFRILCYNEA